MQSDQFGSSIPHNTPLDHALQFSAPLYVSPNAGSPQVAPGLLPMPAWAVDYYARENSNYLVGLGTMQHPQHDMMTVPEMGGPSVGLGLGPVEEHNSLSFGHLPLRMQPPPSPVILTQSLTHAEGPQLRSSTSRQIASSPLRASTSKLPPLSSSRSRAKTQAGSTSSRPKPIPALPSPALEETDASLMQVIIRDNGQKKHVCLAEGCGKSFGRQSDLKRHVAIHTGHRPYACKHKGCDKSFIQPTALKVHERTHTGERPHICEHPGCSKVFFDSSSLARHRRIHTGQKPHVCTWSGCSKTYSRLLHLKEHLQKHEARQQWVEEYGGAAGAAQEPTPDPDEDMQSPITDMNLLPFDHVLSKGSLASDDAGFQALLAASSMARGGSAM